MLTMDESETVFMSADQCFGAATNGRTTVASSGFFQAKCGSHPNSLSCPLSRLQADDAAEAKMVELEMSPTSVTAFHPDNLRCNCCDQNCKIRKYFRYRKHKLSDEDQSPPRRNDLSSSPVDSFSKGFDCDTLAALREVVTLAGGDSEVHSVFASCRTLASRQPLVLSTSASEGGDTVLMQLCSRTPKDEKSERLLYGQIYSFVRLYIESNRSELLFVRNAQGTNALELAGLTDKSAVCQYLARLYGRFGRDVNEPNSHGHTVLHLLARKGDECVGALEALMRMRKTGSSSRLLRIDVVNSGHKTPLDVAAACAEMFSTGKDRTIYTQVIAAFHKVIQEDAEEMLMEN